MSTHHTTKEGHSFLYDKAFFARVLSHIKKDLLSIYNFINLVLITLLGLFLFIVEFPLVKQFLTYVVAIPIAIFITVKYLTLLPTVFFLFFLALAPKHALVSLSVIVVISFVTVLLV